MMGYPHLHREKYLSKRNYLTQEQIYFEPFHAFAKNMAKTRNIFVLDTIPEEAKFFVTDKIFVIKTNGFNVNSAKEENDKWQKNCSCHACL